MTNRFILSRKYATAFLHVYGTTMTMDDYQSLQVFKRAWDNHPEWLHALAIPTVSLERKMTLLERMLAAYQVMPDSMQLMKLLITDKREILISPVIAMICASYLKRAGIVMCTLLSSHALTEHERSIVQQFIARQVGYHIIYDYTVDPSLIAGIKVVSDTFMWEYSVARQLREVELSSRVRNY